ncbi:MAG: SUMF1/EgtB/PvdO family nonheme iron enzyme [Symploca sp. SIO2E9]|nr:SUMF1/EgtB/PvdO family nonheme iron enzyme [Symploca sp. SIO2E9]
MMRTQQEAVLIDFGIAKGINPKTSTQTDMAGNKSFAPYEQVGKGSRQKTVDVYSLAASLYYAVTGECATASLGRKLSNDKLIPPKQLNPSISDRTNKAILKGMALEPEKRPQSIQKWLNLLSVPVSANQVSHDAFKKSSRHQQQATTITTPTPITRKKFLKWAGLGGGSLVTVLVAREIFKPSPIPPTIYKPETIPIPVDKSKTIPIPVDKPKTIPISVAKPKETPPTEGELWTVEFETVTVDARGEVVKREPNKQAQFFKEDLGNGVSLDMVSIPGGKFLMGTEDKEIERLVQKTNWDGFNREKPQHEVTVQPFFMGKYPVTQAQWRAIASREDLKVKRELNPNFKNSQDSDSRPVERVSWYDAVEFCQRLSKQTGREYRLPSEAQWEYACRALTKTPFHFGETITDKLANYNASSTYASEPEGEYRGQTTPVGIFPPNAFGLYDTHGNVWEWCADAWHDNYKGAPNDGTAWVEEDNDNRYRILRGGSWLNIPDDCRCAFRINNYIWRDDIFLNVGIRVVCVAARTT